MRGKVHQVPLDKLSEADREFIAAQLEETEADGGKTDEKSVATGAMTLGGQEITRNGQVSEVVLPLSEEAMEKLKKVDFDGEDFRVGVIAPADFDPSKPQKVLFMTCGTNNATEIERGNIGSARPYAPHALPTGWALIGIDTKAGKAKSSEIHGLLLAEAIAVMKKAWPGFENWTFATGGGSGGAKSSMGQAMQLVALDLPLAGMFITGCNQDLTGESIKESRVKRGQLRDIKVFISNGKDDKISTPAAAEEVESSIKSNGMRTTRLELFDGGHVIYPDHVKSALEWFATTD